MQQIRLSKGLFALVDDEDYDYLMQWKWCASHESRGTKWYAVRWITHNGRRYKMRMHHQVAQIAYGDKMYLVGNRSHVVDHQNHNSLDNRRQNIRIITQRENMLASPGWRRRA